MNTATSTMRIPKIKNYSAAPQQITAEQLMREVPAYRTDDYRPPSSVHVMDQDELEEYKYRMRKEFEDKLRMQRHHMGNWIKYAEWEASIGEFLRARSVFERAMDVDYQHVTLWLKYAEMEMRNKNVNHARNVWERACKHMPRVDQFWYKYVHMEEMLGNGDKVRSIFEDWLTWEPKENAWDAYVKFEERNSSDDQYIERCRSILERFIEVYPNMASYLKLAKFEQKNREIENARAIYERALAELGREAIDENFMIQFTKFEIKQKEYDRANVLFKYATQKLPLENQKRISQQYLDFQKQFGTQKDMESLIAQNTKLQLEQEILKDQYNYDIWFDLLRLVEEQSTTEEIRDTYERAISNKPLIKEKQYWRRYIYFWLYYAIFEEQTTQDVERAKMIYQKLLQEVIPHETFTFSKIWIHYAEFLIRQGDLMAARKVLGQSLGKCPRKKLFRFYIQLETQLGESDRCRKIYERQIQVFSFIPNSWISYALYENSLGEIERARQIFEIGLENEIDQKTELWNAYLKFEESLDGKNSQRVKDLKQRIAQRNNNQ